MKDEKTKETLDYLKFSERDIGQIYPVIKDAKGEIIDGLHRKRTNPDWKEVTLPIEDDLESLKMRVHLNLLRREITGVEKKRWVSSARQTLKKRGFKGTQEEIAKALGMSRTWVEKYDENPTQDHSKKMTRRVIFCDLVRLFEEFSKTVKSECDIDECEKNCPLYEKVCKPLEEPLERMRWALGQIRG